MKAFNNKVAIVTGAASGIGKSLCFALARSKAVVVAADINETGAAETASVLTSQNFRCEPAGLDVTNRENVNALVDRVAAQYGRLDFMFNNAGVVVFADARDFSDEDWRRQLDVNLHGVIHGTMAAYKKMTEQGFGHIVNTASMAGLTAATPLAPYTATKFGVVGLSSTLRAEGYDLGVRISVVCPGLIRTGMFDCPILNVNKDALIDQIPPGAVWTPDRAAHYILRKVAKNSGYIVFPFYARFFWWLERLSPRISFLFRLNMIRKFRRIRKDPSCQS